MVSASSSVSSTSSSILRNNGSRSDGRQSPTVNSGSGQPTIIALKDNTNGLQGKSKPNGSLVNSQRPHPVRTSSDDAAKLRTLTRVQGDAGSTSTMTSNRQQRPSGIHSASGSPDLAVMETLPLPSMTKPKSHSLDKPSRNVGFTSVGGSASGPGPMTIASRTSSAQSSSHSSSKRSHTPVNGSKSPDQYAALQAGRHRSASGSQSKTSQTPLISQPTARRDRSASLAQASTMAKTNGDLLASDDQAPASLPVMPGGFDDRRPSPTSQEGSQISSSPPFVLPDRQESAASGSRNATSAVRQPIKSVSNICSHCHEPIQGQFVRAMDRTFHLNCFTCRDCDTVVAAKFFPVNEEAKEQGEPYQLCETCYFRRLGLLCHNCGLALRGSYIEAAGHKYHVNHFTCSECSTIFGAQDSYYEAPNGKILCFLHYSQNYATRCQGCQQAILQQFVEIERDSAKIAFHPCCYMIHKFWNVRWADMPALAPPPPPNAVASATARSINSDHDREEGEHGSTIIARSHAILLNDPNETAESLRRKQKETDDKVYRIWTILSAYEESSAACISEMLMRISESAYAESVMMAEKFILHVEILFSAMDDLETMFRNLNAKGTSHAREARLLCKKIVNFFSQLANPQRTNAVRDRSSGLMQDLLALVTGLAHYLKILIRIALTGALKLDREYGQHQAIDRFLNKLVILTKNAANSLTLDSPTKASSASANALSTTYKSSVEGSEVTLDQCQACRGTVEDECFRFGRQARWHPKCLRCRNCHREAAKSTLQQFTARELKTRDRGRSEKRVAEFEVFCASCAQEGCRIGFDAVTRLEQYSFLLRCALNRLYSQLQVQGLIPQDSSALQSLHYGATVNQGPLTPDQTAQRRSVYEAFNSTDIRRMKSVDLDRKLSMSGRVATRARVDGVTAPDANDSLHRADADLGLYGPTGTRPHGLRSLSSIRALSDGAGQPAKDYHITNDAASPPASGIEDSNSLTLGDIPQLAVASQGGTRPPSLMQSNRRHISELSPLELFAVKHVAVLMMEPVIKEFFSVEELLDLIEVRKATFWDKIFKGVGKEEKKPAKKKGNFGISLEQLVERNGVDSLLGTGPTRLRIPSFVDDVISAMKHMDLSIEGIFRKNGNIRRLKELCDAIDRDPSSVNLNEENAVQLAALLKKFLRDLPDPLMTFKLHRLWLVSQRVATESDQLKVLHYATLLLPKAHRDTMEVVFAFLRWVASFAHVDEETGSRMDLHNLATVIAPNVLIARGHEPTKDDSFAAIEAVQTALRYQDDFNLVPDECLGILSDPELLAKGDEITPKELLKRCELYARRHAGGPTLSWSLEGPSEAREVSSPTSKSSFPRALSPSRSDAKSPLPRGESISNASHFASGQTVGGGAGSMAHYPTRDYRYPNDVLATQQNSPPTSPGRALLQTLSPTKDY